MFDKLIVQLLSVSRPLCRQSRVCAYPFRQRRWFGYSNFIELSYCSWIKGENGQLTAGWRSKLSHCLMFYPTDTASVKFNLLLAVRRGDNEASDVQNIVDILVDPKGSLEKRNH